MNKEELNKILEQHKLWLDTNGAKGEKAYLSYADLRYAYLSYADLRYADLKGADLSNANLRYVNLSSANLCRADLRYADLKGADLSYANLLYANLKGVDLDYSSYPLWCGSLDIHIDDKQATQLLYHLVRNVLFSKNTSKEMKDLLSQTNIVEMANKFHRVEECGKIEVEE